MHLSQKMKTALTWTGQILLGVLFLMSGLGNMLGGSQVAARFEQWGYPGEFRYAVAAIELLGAIGLMIGAFGTHLFNSQYSRLVINVAIGLILIGIVVARRRTVASGGASELQAD